MLLGDRGRQCWPSAVATAAAAGGKRVILLTNGADPFWDAMRAGMQDAERDFDLADAGLRTVMDVNDGTPKGQVDRLRQYANQSDIAAVAVSVTDSNNLAIARRMEDCQQGGHPGDRDRFGRRPQHQPRGRASPIWAPTTSWAARNWARPPRAFGPQGGKYATFVGLKGAANAIERIDGFAEGAGDKFTQVENLGDEMDLSTALKNVKDALDRHPISTRWSASGPTTRMPSSKWSSSAGIRDKTTIVVFDAAPKAIATHGRRQDRRHGRAEPLRHGLPRHAADEGPGRRRPADDARNAARLTIRPRRSSPTPERRLLTTGLRVVHPDAGSPLKKEMFAETTEFLSLSEFKKWLKAEHHLTGS